MTNTNALRVAIVLSGTKQYRVAHNAHISETRFSKILNGRIDPTPDEKKQIAKVLRKSVVELFGVLA